MANPPFKHALWRELYALRRVFSFTNANSDIKKFLIFTLVVTWGTITIGVAFGAADSTATYSMLTALVWVIVGRLWGGEAATLTKGEK